MPLRNDTVLLTIAPALVLASCLLASFILGGCQSTPVLNAADPASTQPDAGVQAISPGPVPENVDAANTTAYPNVSGPCVASDSVRLWATPLAPRPGEPMEIVAVATDAALEQLFVTGPDGATRPLPADAGGGPPWSLHGSIQRPTAGTYRIDALRGGQVAACLQVTVGGGPGDRGSGDWDLAAQALYAVWVERLFDDPPEQSLSFPSLAPVLADPRRNFLHDYLGAGDDQGLTLGARLRGPVLYSARLLRLEARTARRLSGLQPGQRRQPAALRRSAHRREPNRHAGLD